MAHVILWGKKTNVTACDILLLSANQRATFMRQRNPTKILQHNKLSSLIYWIQLYLIIFMKLFIKLWIGCAVTTLVYTLPVLTLAYPDMVSCKDDTNDVRERFTLYHVVLSHIVLSRFRSFEKTKHK